MPHSGTHLHRLHTCNLYTQKVSYDYMNDHMICKLVNSNVGWESSFPVSVVSRPAMRPSKQTAKAATQHRQKVISLSTYIRVNSLGDMTQARLPILRRRARLLTVTPLVKSDTIYLYLVVNQKRIFVFLQNYFILQKCRKKSKKLFMQKDVLPAEITSFSRSELIK